MYPFKEARYWIDLLLDSIGEKLQYATQGQLLKHPLSSWGQEYNFLNREFLNCFVSILSFSYTFSIYSIHISIIFFINIILTIFSNGISIKIYSDILLFQSKVVDFSYPVLTQTATSCLILRYSLFHFLNSIQCKWNLFCRLQLQVTEKSIISWNLVTSIFRKDVRFLSVVNRKYCHF